MEAPPASQHSFLSQSCPMATVPPPHPTCLRIQSSHLSRVLGVSVRKCTVLSGAGRGPVLEEGQLPW